MSAARDTEPLPEGVMAGDVLGVKRRLQESCATVGRARHSALWRGEGRR